MLRLVDDPRGNMVEAAITLPVTLLVFVFAVNMALAGYASVNANNAANFGARQGSVSSDPVNTAQITAEQAVSQYQVGNYSTTIVAAGQRRGDLLGTQVHWSVPNFFAPLVNLFGAGMDTDLSGDAISYFRVEGW